ncbi:hypothetical protein K1719_044404 [Acacia pycnantha]|nr:hypothetical protein K1719_044404 [Acacia pycnantha]
MKGLRRTSPERGRELRPEAEPRRRFFFHRSSHGLFSSRLCFSLQLTTAGDEFGVLKRRRSTGIVTKGRGREKQNGNHTTLSINENHKWTRQTFMYNPWK